MSKNEVTVEAITHFIESGHSVQAMYVQGQKLINTW